MLVFIYDNGPNFPKATFCKIQIFPNFWFDVFEKQNWFHQTFAYSSFVFGVVVLLLHKIYLFLYMKR